MRIIEKVYTNEIYDKATIRSSTNWLMEESFTIWQNLRVKCCSHATSIRIGVTKVEYGWEITML